jgi:outer membrane protein assembly factor BamB
MSQRYLKRSLLALLALLLSIGCARNYRLDEAPRGAVAPRDVFRLMWQRRLVKREFLDFRPQEWASAILDGDRVYVGSSAGRFMAFDTTTGRRLWTFKAQSSISSEPTLDEGRLYFGADDGKLYAVDAKTGKLLWSYTTQGTINTAPAVAEGFLLFTSSEGRVYALDADSGKWRWQYDREAPEGFTIHGYAGVAVKGSTAFTGFADGTLVALRVYSGDVVWTRSLTRGKAGFVDVDATPVVEGDVLLTTSYSGGVFAISTENGSIRWQYPVEGASALTIHRRQIYFTAPAVGVVALDLGGRLVWRQAIPKGVPSVPVASGPYLFVTGTESGLFAVSASTGRLLQYFDPGHGISAPPSVGEGFLATLTNQGRLYLFRVEL